MSPTITVVAAAAAVVLVGGRIDARAVAGQEAGIAGERCATTGDALLVGIAVFTAFAAIVELRGEVSAAIAAVNQPRRTATYPVVTDPVGGAFLIASAAMFGVRIGIDAFAVAERGAGIASAHPGFTARGATA